jgi:hypothetical protein
MSLSTPILLLIFNRPDLTRQVFAKIRSAKPRQLLVVADGPRKEREGEAELCDQARAVLAGVDWPCDLRTEFAKSNLGCGKRISSGITWAFSHVDRAIILEDDCLPAESFFPFCEAMLREYSDDPRVMNVAGFCHRRLPDLPQSYFFTKIPCCWGWATWRRAWSLYDFDMAHWESYRESGGWEFFGSNAAYLKHVFEEGRKNEIDTWDHQWAFTCLLHHGLSVAPKVPLIQNIGFRADATHTTAGNRFAMQRSEELAFPLTHPREVAADRRLNNLALREQLEIPPVEAFQRGIASALRRLVQGARRHALSRVRRRFP